MKNNNEEEQKVKENKEPKVPNKELETKVLYFCKCIICSQCYKKKEMAMSTILGLICHDCVTLCQNCDVAIPKPNTVLSDNTSFFAAADQGDKMELFCCGKYQEMCVDCTSDEN